MTPKPNYIHTYLPYPAGIDPDLLRIGTLAVDIFNPFQSFETNEFRFKEKLNKVQYDEYIKKTAGYSSKEELNRSLRFVASHEWGMSAGLVDLAHAGINNDSELSVAITGGKARRIEIHQPVKFLEEHVKKQEGLEKFIERTCTAAWPSAWFLGHKKIPKIWVCTGVHLISKARVSSDSSTDSSQSMGLKLDAGLLTTGVPTGTSIAKVDLHHQQGQQADTKFAVEEYLVWAAKWFPLDISYVKPGESEKGIKTLIIKLRPVEDLGSAGIREDAKEISSTGDDGERVAVVKGLQKFDSSPFEDPENDIEMSDEIDEKVYSEAMEGVDQGSFAKYRSYVDFLP